MLEFNLPEMMEDYADHFKFRRFFLPLGNVKLLGVASSQPYDRLLFIISGEKVEPMEFEEGVRDVRLCGGDAYLVAKNRGEFQSWLTPHKMLCIIPRPTYLRVALHDVTLSQGAYDPHWATARCHTAKPPSEALLAVFAALKDRNCADGDHIRLLLRAALKLAARECAEAVQEGGKALATFNRLCTYVENHFCEAITREEVADRFGLNPQYVSQLFRKMRGGNFLDYLTRCRLERARELLVESNLTIKEISMRLGFNSEIYFVRRFREKVGIAPGQYRIRAWRFSTGNNVPSTNKSSPRSA